jgi:hypothetical protein
MVIEAQSARVPNQLISPETASIENRGTGDEDEWVDGQEDSVEEFCGAGAIAGYTLPLGMGAGNLNHKIGLHKNNKKKRKS